MINIQSIQAQNLIYFSVNNGHDLSYDSKFRVTIQKDGLVSWTPGIKWQTSCQVNLRYFPFDIQTCSVRLINWVYSAALVNLTVPSEEVILVVYENSSEWQLLSAEQYNTKWDFGEVVYPIVYLKITMKRLPMFFVISMVLPIILMTVMSFLVFLVPAESGEKVSLAVTVILSYSVVILMVTDIAPRTGDRQPIIGKCLSLF